MADKKGRSQAEVPRVALLWVHFGPYHLARLRALRRNCHVTAIQFASSQEMYGWRTNINAELITLRTETYRAASSLEGFLRLWTILKETNPDVLFIPGYREPLALVAALWGKVHGRTNVLMSDSTVFDQPRSKWKESLKARLARCLFQKAFVSGKRSASYLQSLNCRHLFFEVGYDVVDNEHFATRVAAIQASKLLDLRSRPFLFVGRLVAAKNLSLLLDAFAAYRRFGGKRSLEIIGHGPLESSLKASAAVVELSGAVSFGGFQTYESLPERYAHAACLILPSISEPWGLVVNEAMAAGLPVIVSDRCGCVDDLVEDGSNGYVFPALSSKALTDCLLTIDALDDRCLKAMGRRSKEMITKFSLETWVNAVLRLAQGRPNAPQLPESAASY